MITPTKTTVRWLQVVAVIMMTLATPVSSRHPRSARGQQLCSEPVNLKDRLEELHEGRVEGYMHDTFLLVPTLRDALTNTTNPLSDSANCTKVFSGSEKCPHNDAHDDSPGDPCPTYTCLNVDNNRYPHLLLETRCSCKIRCRGVRKLDKMTPTCEGVFYHVRVLKRTGCKLGVYQYVATWHSLQVGCACKFVP